VPVWLEPADAETFLRDVIGLMREGRLDEKKAELANEELARLAAQKAVRLPAAVNEPEALALVAQLFGLHPAPHQPGGPADALRAEQGGAGAAFPALRGGGGG